MTDPDDDVELERRLGALPRSIEPPEDLWPGVRARLAPRRGALALVRGGASLRGLRVLPSHPWRAAAAVGLLAVGVAALLRVRGAQSDWRLAGQGRQIRPGEMLVTGQAARARLEVGSIGEVALEPGSRIRLLKARATEHRMALIAGTIHARITAPPRLFVVETPGAVAVDLGCAYTLETDTAGDTRIHVTMGWVSFEREEREVLVPAGFLAESRGGALHTPYAEDASDALRGALLAFDLSGRSDALASVLREARPRDAITLWHLLSRTEANARTAVLDRLAALAPPPDEVRREAVMDLDPRALRLWWERLPGALPITPEWRRALWVLWLRLTG